MRNQTEMFGIGRFMSRLGGISVYYRDEEICAWNWKNYLCVDTVIIEFLRLQCAPIKVSADEENISIKFHYETFMALITYLKLELNEKFWEENEYLLPYDKSEVIAYWDRILRLMSEEADRYYNCTKSFFVMEFYECN